MTSRFRLIQHHLEKGRSLKSLAIPDANLAWPVLIPLFDDGVPDWDNSALLADVPDQLVLMQPLPYEDDDPILSCS